MIETKPHPGNAKGGTPVCGVSRLLMKIVHALLWQALFASATQIRAELRVPASTAYVEPEPEALKVSPNSGISGWTNPALTISWFGEIKRPGRLDCSVALRLPANAESRLRLTVAGASSEAIARAGES